MKVASPSIQVQKDFYSIPQQVHQLNAYLDGFETNEWLPKCMSHIDSQL